MCIFCVHRHVYFICVYKHVFVYIYTKISVIGFKVVAIASCDFIVYRWIYVYTPIYISIHLFKCVYVYLPAF
jgi:hypothetical protein